MTSPSCDDRGGEIWKTRNLYNDKEIASIRDHGLGDHAGLSCCSKHLLRPGGHSLPFRDGVLRTAYVHVRATKQEAVERRLVGEGEPTSMDSRWRGLGADSPSS